jgi:hypothetical protein
VELEKQVENFSFCNLCRRGLGGGEKMEMRKEMSGMLLRDVGLTQRWEMEKYNSSLSTLPYGSFQRKLPQKG